MTGQKVVRVDPAAHAALERVRRELEAERGFRQHAADALREVLTGADRGRWFTLARREYERARPR